MTKEDLKILLRRRLTAKLDEIEKLTKRGHKTKPDYLNDKQKIQQRKEPRQDRWFSPIPRSATNQVNLRQ